MGRAAAFAAKLSPGAEPPIASEPTTKIRPAVSGTDDNASSCIGSTCRRCHRPNFIQKMKSIQCRLLKIGSLIIMLILIAKCVLIAFQWNDPINQFRRLLANRHEKRSNADEFGDYSLYITGNLPASRFTEAALLLGLDGHLRENSNSREGWQHFGDDPSAELPRNFDEQYEMRGNGYSVQLGRSGDRVFYQTLSW